MIVLIIHYDWLDFKQKLIFCLFHFFLSIKRKSFLCHHQMSLWKTTQYSSNVSLLLSYTVLYGLNKGYVAFSNGKISLNLLFAVLLLH